MLDPQDEAYDRRLAKHLVSLYHQTPEQEEIELMVGMGEAELGRGVNLPRGVDTVVSR